MKNLLYYSLALYLSLHGADAWPEPAASTPSGTPRPPCTIRSPTSGAFFDLNGLHIEDPSTSKSKHPRLQSWNTSGWDYGYNFTMNFCGPVIEELDDVVGVDKSLWKNVSAYYTYKDRTFSIGQQNSWPVLRGRKLVLNYTGGSPCDETRNRRETHEVEDLWTRAQTVRPGAKNGEGDDEDDDKDEDDRNKNKGGSGRNKSPIKDTTQHRKSAIISLLCDRDPLSLRLTLNFVGADEQQCAYFFEARSVHACGGVEAAQQTLSPGGVFGVIVLIAMIVYIVGGVVYSRVVLQQRGWRQCPNYGLWAGTMSFVADLFVILTSSCSRCLPSRRGYNQVSGIGAGRGRGVRDSDAENRLIDELNEEWDD